MEVFQRRNKQKRGSWSMPKTVISVEIRGKNITVPGKNGHKVCVAFEDLRKSVAENDLTKLISDGIDHMDKEIEEYTDQSIASEPENEHPSDDGRSNIVRPTDFNPDLGISDDNVVPQVGDSISVFWPMDDQFYPGTVHDVENDQHTIHYDDGDVEVLNLSEEQWQYNDSNNHNIANSN